MDTGEVDRLACAVASACHTYTREQILDAFILILVASGSSDASDLPIKIARRLRQLAENPAALDAPQPLVDAIAARLGTHSKSRLDSARALLGITPKLGEEN